jgi:hypothetical protein
MAGEINRNPMPEFHVLPKPVEAVIEGATRVGKFLGAIVFNTNVPLRESDHYVREHFHPEDGEHRIGHAVMAGEMTIEEAFDQTPNTGGGPMLDEQLYTD